MEEEEGVEEKPEEEADERTGEEVYEETEKKAVENNEKEEKEKVLLFYQKLNIPAAEYRSIHFLLFKLLSTRTFNVMSGNIKSEAIKLILILSLTKATYFLIEIFPTF